MSLEGVVTNVANFGAFVDIGVHQDGLVHVSELADRFVRDPREVVRAGQVVRVRVVEVDVARKRIALTMRSGDARNEPVRKAPNPRLDDQPRTGEARRTSGDARRMSGDARRTSGPSRPAPATAMQAAFAALKKR